MSRLWLYIRITQIVLDSIGIYLAFLLAYFVRVGWVLSSDFLFWPYAYVTFGATAIWIGVLLASKYYRVPPRSGKRQLFDLFLSLLGGGMSVSLVLVVFLFERAEIFSRALTLMAFVFGVVFLFVTREVVYIVMRRFKKTDNLVHKALIVGANRLAVKLTKDIAENAYAPYKVIGVIDPYGIAKSFDGAPLLGKLNKLESVCDEHKVTKIIQCDAFEHTMNIISFCEEKRIGFQFAPALRGVHEDSTRIREVAGNTFISFVNREEKGVKGVFGNVADWVLHQVFDID